MKHLLVFSVIILVIYGCKKQDTPTPTPVNTYQDGDTVRSGTGTILPSHFLYLQFNPDSTKQGVTYIWKPGSGLNTTIGSIVLASPSSTITYTCTSSDAKGYSAKDSIKVIVQ